MVPAFQLAVERQPSMTPNTGFIIYRDSIDTSYQHRNWASFSWAAETVKTERDLRLIMIWTV